jgi:hypothetical protein
MSHAEPVRDPRMGVPDSVVGAIAKKLVLSAAGMIGGKSQLEVSSAATFRSDLRV